MSDDAPDIDHTAGDPEIVRQVDVEISEELWDRMQEHIAAQVEHQDKEVHLAWWDTVHEYVRLMPNLVVDGEAVTPSDVTVGEER